MVACCVGLIVTHASAFSPHAPTLSRVAKSRTVCPIHMVGGMELCKRFGMQSVLFLFLFSSAKEMKKIVL
jgi:hypothetical protein